MCRGPYYIEGESRFSPALAYIRKRRFVRDDVSGENGTHSRDTSSVFEVADSTVELSCKFLELSCLISDNGKRVVKLNHGS